MMSGGLVRDIFAVLVLILCSGVARADNPNGLALLTRCLQCLQAGCDDHGLVTSNATDEPNDLMADMRYAVKNTDNGQKLVVYHIRSEVLIVAGSPPARRPITGQGLVPGFFLYEYGTSYFCPTSQIKSRYNDDNPLGQAFKISVPLRGWNDQVVDTVERGFRLTRNFKDQSLGNAWALKDNELKASTPTLRCVEDGDFTEEKAANNPEFAVADTIRFSVLDAAKTIAGRSIPFERDRFIASTKAACMNPKMPFRAMLAPKIYQAWDLVNAKPRSSFEKFFLPKDDAQKAAQ